MNQGYEILTDTNADNTTTTTTTMFKSNIRLYSFAVPIPTDMNIIRPHDPDSTSTIASILEKQKQQRKVPIDIFTDKTKCIVGTITLLGTKSIMVWFGWGQVQTNATTNSNIDKLIGNALQQQKQKQQQSTSDSQESKQSNLMGIGQGMFICC